MLIIKTSSRPAPGLWYYVWDGEKWELMVWKAHESSMSGHAEIWESVIAPSLAGKLGLPPSKARQLAEIPYCVPRGRVDATGTPDKVLAGEYDWRLYHGNDFPAGLGREAEERKLISAFDLTGPLIRGLAKFEVAPHEMMLPQHRQKFQELTGLSIPD